MTDTVREWIAKAEGDFGTAGRELAAPEPRNLDAVCYHAQQCIEKLMKAAVIDRGGLPPKVHDLVTLDQIMAPLVPNWSWPLDELRLLTRAAVAFRYPGESADEGDAVLALDICARLRAALLALFPPPP